MGEAWGGSAKGQRPAFTPTRQPGGAAVAAGIAAARTAAEAAKPHVERMVEVWRKIAENEAEPSMVRVVAADKLVDRAEGKPNQRTHLTGGLAVAAVPFDPEALPDHLRDALREILLVAAVPGDDDA